MTDYGRFGPTEQVECVVCPDCAFTFAAKQLFTDDGTASCPYCEEERLRALNEELAGALTDFVSMGDSYGWQNATTGRQFLMRNARAVLSKARAKEGSDAPPMTSGGGL